MTRYVLFLLFFLWSSAFAASSGTYWNVPGGSGYPSADAACQWLFNSGGGSTGGYAYSGAQTVTPTSADCKKTNSTTGVVVSFGSAVAYTRTCSGTNGQFNPSTGTCFPGCPSSGTTLSDSGVQTTAMGTTACIGGCAVTGAVSTCAGSTSDCALSGPIVATGGTCDPSSMPTLPSPADTPASAPNPCPAGQVSGTINGTSVCAPGGKTQETTTSSSSTSSTSTSASGVSTSASGSSSGTSTSTCDGSSCTTTTTTTTTNSDGSSSTTTDTSTLPQSDYCTLHPNAAACTNSSSWGGGCDAFACSGDAVQCAQAQAAWKLACDFEKTGDLQAQGEAAATGAARPSGHPALSPSVVSLGAGTFDQTNPYSDACPAALTFSVGGQSISADYCNAWPFVQALGHAAVAICLVVAARMVIGAI